MFLSKSLLFVILCTNLPKHSMSMPSCKCFGNLESIQQLSKSRKTAQKTSVRTAKDLCREQEKIYIYCRALFNRSCRKEFLRFRIDWSFCRELKILTTVGERTPPSGACRIRLCDCTPFIAIRSHTAALFFWLETWTNLTCKLGDPKPVWIMQFFIFGSIRRLVFEVCFHEVSEAYSLDY